MKSRSDGVTGAVPTTRKQTTGFPVLSLPEVADALRSAAKVGTTHTLASLAGILGHKTTNSGPFRRKLAALRELGVVEGRADRISISTTGLSIALPRDPEDEAVAFRVAFMNSPVFAQAYRAVVKNRELDLNSIANTAVHNHGISAASRDEFVRSFVSSATAAGLAERVGERQVRFLPEPAEGEPVAVGPVAVGPAAGRPMQAQRYSENPRMYVRADGELGRPVLRQVWPTEGGQVVVEIRSATPLRPDQFTQLARVVSEVEALAGLLGHKPARGAETGDASE